MNESDYDKYYKKGGTYVIPVEIFNELFDELERLKKELQQAKEIALNEHKYASEMEDKYITANNIINELEKELKEDYKIWMCNSRSNGKSVKFGIDVCKTHFYNRLQELKENNIEFGSDRE